MGKIGFIGSGRMATALAQGFVRAGLYSEAHVIASDSMIEALERFKSALPGAEVSQDNAYVASEADLIVLAVKPQKITTVLNQIASSVDDKKLVISIAAGIRLGQLAESLPVGARLVRVMPNTPCLVGQSASAYCLGGGATKEDGRQVDQLLSAVGKAFFLEEDLLDAVTGLSGSGPAYVCLAIEALRDGGEQVGLTREVAEQLAVQTMLGTAQMIAGTGEPPERLRAQVTSPGGTTVAGLQALADHGFRDALIAAVAAATARSKELGDR